MASSPYTDLDRPPLGERSLQRALIVPGGFWQRLEVRAETGSTNADVAAAARAGAPRAWWWWPSSRSPAGAGGTGSGSRRRGPG